MSTIPALEPLLGVGFAVNLSYLYIPWFHYLQGIGKTAKQALSEGTDSKDILGEYSGEDSVNCVQYLSSLGTGTKGPDCKLFDKLWSYPLRIFTWRVDKMLSVISTIFIIYMLVIGVAHQIGLYQSTLVEISDNQKHWFLHLAAICIISPLIMSAIALWLRVRVKSYVLKTVGEYAVKEKTDAATAFGNKPDI